jgi:signal transduction histidine kinase
VLSALLCRGLHEQSGSVLGNDGLARQTSGFILPRECPGRGAFGFGGEIRVRAEVREGEVVIAVEDNGAGIAPEELPLIFSRGVKLHANANTAGELGGELTCVSQGPGTGARFSLVLPARAKGGGSTGLS